MASSPSISPSISSPGGEIVLSANPFTTDSEVTIQEIRSRALSQPLENFAHLRQQGAIFVTIARPRRFCSMLLTQTLRNAWDWMSASSVGLQITQTLNTRTSDWTAPVPDPQTLVLARRRAEVINRT